MNQAMTAERESRHPFCPFSYVLICCVRAVDHSEKELLKFNELAPFFETNPAVTTGTHADIDSYRI